MTINYGDLPRKFKRPTPTVSPLRQEDCSWARSNSEKAKVFAEHLGRTFTPLNNQEDEETNSYLDAPCQLSPPIRSITPAEVIEQIKLTNSQKIPGHDLIVGETLKHLPRNEIVLLTTLYNRMLHLSYFPTQWKFAQIIMIAKSGKPPIKAASYRPIRMLPILSKIFERLLQKKKNKRDH
jgi:hypothetical protein